jgi:NTP pyrophosphatase (non-canonical NTP hydrolase)
MSEKLKPCPDGGTCINEDLFEEQIERIAILEEQIERIRNRVSQSLASVLDERERQEQKWGEQNHDPFTYLTILVEEVGEFAQAALHLKYGGRYGELNHLREEAIHMAAVSLAIVECLNRKKWVWPELAHTVEQEGSS